MSSVKTKRYIEGTDEDAVEVEVMEFRFWDKLTPLLTALKAQGELKEAVVIKGDPDNPLRMEHVEKRSIPSISGDEFEALPVQDQLSRLHEAIQVADDIVMRRN